MKNIEELRQQLELAFTRYMRLEDDEQQAAMDMTVVMLRQMMREQSGRRQRLAELSNETQNGTVKRSTRSNAEKARSTLVRKTNASSPKVPIKPVQTTRKNELRRD
jgi:hypothetical protein